ncbi:MAG: hypothetical protein AAF943_03705 [Pseudomonadota bacterium]
MARLFLILAFLAALAATAIVLASVSRKTIAEGTRDLRAPIAALEDRTMASSGVQKAAFVALIVVLFGVASGWLGGL